MIKVTKRITALILSFVMLLSTTVFATELKKGDIYVFNEKVEGANYVITQSNTTMVPVRSFCEYLGFEVIWNPNKSITIEIDDRALNLGENFVLIDGKSYIDLYDLYDILSLNLDYEIVNGDLFIGSEHVVDTDMPVFTDEDVLAMQEMMNAIMLQIYSSDEFANLVDYVINNDNFVKLAEEVITSDNFKPAMEELLYSEELIKIIEIMEATDAYKAYLKDVKALDSYKAVCKETGFTDLTLDSRDMELDDLLDYYYKVYTAPSFMEYMTDTIELESYRVLIADTTLNSDMFEDVFGVAEYTDEALISKYPKTLALIEELSNSKYLEPLAFDIENSDEFKAFTVYVEKLFENFFDEYYNN